MSLVVKEIKELSVQGVAPAASSSPSLYQRALREFGTWEQACKRAGVNPRRGYTNLEMRKIHREHNQMTPAVWSFVEGLVETALKENDSWRFKDGRNLLGNY